MLPNFLIIGAARSGTTYLKNVLEQHPDIYMGYEGAYTGDIHFFNTSHPAKNWDKGLNWYERFFDGRKDERAVGQKSSLYLDDPEAPKLIKQILGDEIKLIAILRNPIKRAYSSYWYQIEDFPVNTRFLEACALEKNNQLKHKPFLHRPGFYYEHLINYLKYFNKEQLLFLILDYVKKNPLGEIKRVYRFLDIDDAFIPENYDKKVNQAIGKTGFTYGLKKCWGHIKQKHPNFYGTIKILPLSRWLRFMLGKSSDKAASKKGYPEMSLDEWQYLSDLYYESSKKIGSFLGIDLISLWHKRPDKFAQ